MREIVVFAGIGIE